MTETNGKPRILVGTTADLHLSNKDFENKAAGMNIPDVNSSDSKKEPVEPKPKTKSPLSDSFDEAAAAVAGALLSEGIDFVQDKIKNARSEKTDTAHTNDNKESTNKFGDLSFGEIVRRLRDKEIPDYDKRFLQTVRDRAIRDVEDLDNGNYLDNIRDRIREELPNLTWENVSPELMKIAASCDDQLISGGGRKEWRGIMTQAIGAEVSKLRLDGIAYKELTEGVSAGQMPEEWYKTRGYESNKLKNLNENYNKFHIFDLLPPNAEQLVGGKIRSDNNEHSQIEGKKFQEFEEGVYKMFEALEKKETGVSIDALREVMGQGDPKEIKKLYRDAEKGMYPIPSGLEVPKFLIHTPELVDQWNARSRLSSACNFKRMAKGPDELGQNLEAQAITNEQLELLLRMPGVLEAKSIETTFIHEKVLNNKTKLMEDMRLDILVKKSGDQALIDSCPDTIFKISEGKHLEGFRKAKIYWLMTNRGLSREQAEDAEVVSRNLTFLSNEHESGDTRYDSDGKLVMSLQRKFASPTVPLMKSLNAWQLMHMQERLQAKTESSRETWGPFGPWALNKYLKNLGKKTINENGSRKTVDDPHWSVSSMKLLPTKLVPDAFEYIKDGRGKTFSSIFKENGKKLLNNPRTSKSDLDFPDFGGEISEGPFSGYSFLALSPASTIFKVVNDPDKFDQNWNGLGNALSSCEVSSEYREKILLAIYGVDPKSDNLSPIGGLGGKIGFNAFKRQVQEQAPNFWRN